MQVVNILSTKTIIPKLMAHASDAGIRIRNIDFIRTEPQVNEEKAMEFRKLPVADLVFTSARSVEALHQLLIKYPAKLPGSTAYCMSGRTLEKLGQLFPELTVLDTGNNAMELAKKIIENGTEEIIFFCGNLRRDELPLILKQKGIRVNELEIYSSYLTPVQLQEQPDGIIFFSPSAVESFFKLNILASQAVCFAIGKTTADALSAYTNNKIIVADFPRQENVIDMVIHHFNNQ